MGLQVGLTAQLGEIGFESFVETDTGFEAFIPVKNYSQENLNSVLNEFLGEFTFSVSNEIIIEPNMAFGTGNHETTALVIESILENNFEGKTVLDMGCGTGILGILASKKGAKQITAIDIDEWSFNGTKENAILNNIKNIDIKLGDAGLLGNEKYDTIFANIHKNILLNDMQTYVDALQPTGILIMSSFYTEDIPAIKTKAESLGLTDIGFKSRNNWVAHSFQKKQ